MVSSDQIQYVRRRALGVLFATALGIIWGVSLSTPNAILWFAVSCILITGSLLIQSWPKSVLLFFAVITLACGWSQLRLQQTPIDRLDRVVAHDGSNTSGSRVPIRVRGVIVDTIKTQRTTRQPGEPAMWKTTKTSTQLRIEEVFLTDYTGSNTDAGGWTNASGRAKLILPTSFIESTVYAAGDRVELVGMYLPTGSRRNFGDLDWKLLGAQSKRVGSIILTDQSLMTWIEHPNMISKTHGTLTRWRSEFESRATRSIGLGGIDQDQPQRAMLGAFLLGQRDPSFGDVYESFQRVGVAHVLAISGFHLAMVIFLGVFFIRFMGEYPRAETGVVICILVLGMLVIPMRPPIVRAGVIVIAMLISSQAGRRYDRLTTLAWVGCGLLIWRPMDVYSLGYQLSMGITALLIMLSNIEQRATLNRATFTLAHEKRSRSPQGIVGRILRSIIHVTKVNIACWLVAIPVIVFHAGIVSPLAPIVSLVLIPMIVVTMVFGYAQIALGVVFPELAMHTIVIIDWIAMMVSMFVGWVDELPGSSIRVPMVDWSWALGTTTAVTLLVTKQARLENRLTQVMCLAMLAWTLVVFAGPTVLNNRAPFRIDMIDVGDGSCYLLQSQGEGLIWDCGSLDRRVGELSARAARQVGIPKIRTAIVTHDNIDHFNGLIKIAPLVGLEHIWVSPMLMTKPSKGWIETSVLLEAMGVAIDTLSIGQTILLGNANLECLWPDPIAITGLSGNNTSVVIRVVVAQNGHTPRTVLMTGDIEHEAMEAIMHTYPDLKADVLELPHHGSAKRGAFSFVRTLAPAVVLQSTGPSRLNDSRWNDIREGTRWYTSADLGGAWVEIDRNGKISHGWAWE